MTNAERAKASRQANLERERERKRDAYQRNKRNPEFRAKERARWQTNKDRYNAARRKAEQ